MRLKSVIITFFSCFLLAMPLAAQAPQEVTLTVSSDGSTKEEATKNALRSAIEQAYGAFVSANTTILNDELVKDEIVTVSNGSIKDYKEISAVQAENGNYFVTLSATVSLPNLITYAKSHGSECEFAGNTFGMEMKLFELQKENERFALNNLLKQIDILVPQVMTWNLKLSEPSIDSDKYKIEATVSYVGTSDIDYETVIKAKGFPEGILDYDEKAIKKLKLSDIDKFLIYDMRRDREKNHHYFNEIDLLIYNTLSMLAIDKESSREWKRRGINTGFIQVMRCDSRLDTYRDESVLKSFYLRSEENAKHFKNALDSLITTDAINFVIKDNTGQVSDPNLLRPSLYERYDYDKKLPIYRNVVDKGMGRVTIRGTGLLSPQYVCILLDGGKSYDLLNWHRHNHPYDCRFGRNRAFLEFHFTIPKEDIGKYSKFWIERKQ